MSRQHCEWAGGDPPPLYFSCWAFPGTDRSLRRHSDPSYLPEGGFLPRRPPKLWGQSW